MIFKAIPRVRLTEVVAVVSDIIGVAGAGFRLSLILNAVSCEVEGEGLEVHNISKTVTLFSLALKNVGISLQSPDTVHSSEALEGVYKISEDAVEVFDQFNEMLERVRAKPAEGSSQGSIQQRFRWIFKKHHVEYMLAQLESLKMDASLFQQILTLGKLMAATNKHDPPDEVALKQELIRQQRAEAQNVLIVRYWHRSKMEKLWEASVTEHEDLKITVEELKDEDDLALVTSNPDNLNGDNNGTKQLAIEAPPSELHGLLSSSTALVKLPSYSLGDLDEKLDGIKKSSKDMVQVSSDVLEPLLEKWTRWYEVREKRHVRETKNRYVPTVDNLQEDDNDGMHPYRRYNDTNESNAPPPKGYYLEGNTTDWRQPQSAEARQTYSRRRKQYSQYQPTISVDNSDADTNSNGSRSKNAPRRHIIDSSSESDVSDHDPQTQHRQRPRKGSNSPTQERSYPVFPNVGAPRVAPPSPMTNRPHPHHAYTAPAHGYPAQSHHPFPPNQQGYPISHYPSTPQQQPYPNYSTAHARYTPANVTANTNGHPNPPPSKRIPIPQPYPPSNRPVSRDGASSTRSSSYSNRHAKGQQAQPLPTRDRDGRQIHYDGQSRPFVYDDKGQRIRANIPEAQGSGGKGSKGKLAEGATKGLLGAGAIAGFLEALEGLSI